MRNMEVIVKCVPSAFKHKGVTEAGIRHAILNWEYDDVFENEPEKHLLIGFDNFEGISCYEVQRRLPAAAQKTRTGVSHARYDR